MTDTPEIKPCPFCGGNAKFDKTVYKEVGVVRCQECRASNGIVTQEYTAIKAWNTRSSSGNGPKPVNDKDLFNGFEGYFKGINLNDYVLVKKSNDRLVPLDKNKVINLLNEMQSDGADELEYCSHQDKQSLANIICKTFGQPKLDERVVPSVEEITKKIQETKKIGMLKHYVIEHEWAQEIATAIRDLIVRKMKGKE